jgi:hypothetical protein
MFQKGALDIHVRDDARRPQHLAILKLSEQWAEQQIPRHLQTEADFAQTVQTLVSLWSPHPDDLTTPIGQALDDRLRWSARAKGLSAQQRLVIIRNTIRELNELSREVSEGASWQSMTAETLPGALPRLQQIVVWSALAVIDGSPVCVVSGVSPVANDAERALWWHGLEQFGTSEQTIAVMCLPPLRSLTPIPSHIVLDVGSSRLSEVGA